MHQTKKLRQKYEEVKREIVRRRERNSQTYERERKSQTAYNSCGQT